MHVSSIRPHGRSLLAAMLATALVACGSGSHAPTGQTSVVDPPPPPAYVGAVYAGTNNAGPEGNSVVGFGRLASGMLVPLDAFPTGGTGRAAPASAGPRLNSLVAEDSVIAVEGRYLLVVNAGTNDVTCFAINADFSLTRTDIKASGGTSPISLAYRDRVVYVANADEDGVFIGPPNQSGNITAMRLDLSTGKLDMIAGSSVSLPGRPSDIEVTPDGRYLLVSSVNAGSILLPDSTAAEISTFLIHSDGTLAATPSGTGQSTSVGNDAGRNLPNAIGIETYDWRDRQFVIAAEARTVSSIGVPPASFSDLQTGSVSTWEIASDGALLPRSQDYMLERTDISDALQAGFLAYSPATGTIFVSSSTGATLSGYATDDDGTIFVGKLLANGFPVDLASSTPLANADGYMDLAFSPDAGWLYQLVGLKGRIDVYQADSMSGISLSLSQQVFSPLLPYDNLQGLAAVGPCLAPSHSTEIC